jgi:tRNA (guanine-N7-)-methyltransferase
VEIREKILNSGGNGEHGEKPVAKAGVQPIPEYITARNAARRSALAAKLAELYPAPVSIVLELGCGHGHFLTAYAAAHPETQCLGVDFASARIARAQRKQRRLDLKNLAFLQGDVAEVLAGLPQHVRFTGLFILFPDPWPKSHHHRRRFLQPSIVKELAARSQPQAWLALRTDHAGFFDWAREQIAAEPVWRIAPEIKWPFEHPTVFQELKGPYQSLVAVRRGGSAGQFRMPGGQ